MLRLALQGAQFNDALTEIARKLLVPAYLLEVLGESGETPLEAFSQAFGGQYPEKLEQQLANALLTHVKHRCNSSIEIIRLIEALSLSWHHGTNTFPDLAFTNPDRPDLPKQIISDRSWHPLVEAPFTASNGYRIQCLTTTAALKAETSVLGHCVGGYSGNCCRDESPSHIFSVRDAKGRQKSTIELFCQPAGDAHNASDKSVLTPDKKWRVRVSQHEGLKVHGKKHIITQGAEHDALIEFLRAIETGQVAVQAGKVKPEKARIAAVFRVLLPMRAIIPAGRMRIWYFANISAIYGAAPAPWMMITCWCLWMRQRRMGISIRRI